jgi:D-alanyl-D-alanine endopeptidase (penicillin-binding protein 7)
MLVQSNNHSAEEIAARYGRDKFIQLMNFKAQQLGMDDTRFIDPSGLGMNISTAEDVALMIARANAYPEIRAAAFPTVQTVIPKGKRAHLALLSNTNYNLLKEFTHINTSKTGYTHHHHPRIKV